MNGGASQFETFDMKPGRPTGGPFRPISTNVAGTQVCELMPKMAQQMDKIAVIRSMQTSEVDHPGRHLPDAHRLPAVGRTSASPRSARSSPSTRGRKGPTCRTSSRCRPTATPAAGSWGRSISRSASAPEGEPAAVFASRNGSRPLEARRHELRSFVEDRFAAEHKAKSASMHREAYESGPPAAERTRGVQDRRRVGEAPRAVRRQRIRPPLPAGPQAGRARGAVRRGRARAATTRTPTTSPGTRASSRRWSTPGPACSPT